MTTADAMEESEETFNYDSEWLTKGELISRRPASALRTSSLAAAAIFMHISIPIRVDWLRVAAAVSYINLLTLLEF